MMGFTQANFTAVVFMVNWFMVALVLIVISAVFKGIALKRLSNKDWDLEVRKKKYIQMNIVSYVFLVPGVIALIYDMFFQ